MAWIELRVHTALPQFAEELLLAHGAAAVSFVDAADDPVLEPAPGETPLWHDTITIGLFAGHADLAPAVASLREILPEGAALKTSAALVEDRDWIRAWLKDCPPLQFGERLWVAPLERATEVRDPAAVIVRLDPGLAFGTGTHPSTALCLEWLASQELAGAQVLDYGCGSGVLAIAALALGAARAVGTDIDPQALTAARDNAAANGVADRFSAVAAAECVPFPADVVLANILANPLIALAPRLACSIRPGGQLVLAGLLESQAGDVRRAYAPWFDFAADAVRDGWIRVCGRCRTPALINDLALSQRLRTAGQPQPGHFDALARGGVRAVINLAMPASPNFLPDEGERWRALGVDYVHIPVPWEQPTAADLEIFFRHMDRFGDRPLLVHCALNMRVSAFVFLYRVLRANVAPEDAYRDVLRIWRPNDVWRSFIEGTLARHQVKFSLAQSQ